MSHLKFRIVEEPEAAEESKFRYSLLLKFAQGNFQPNLPIKLNLGAFMQLVFILRWYGDIVLATHKIHRLGLWFTK